MHKGFLSATLAAAALLAMPAGQASADPLVSGYGGPGSGEQSLLGSTLLPGGGSKGGGSGSGKASTDASGSGSEQASIEAAPAAKPEPASATPAPATASKPKSSATQSPAKKAGSSTGKTAREEAPAASAGTAATPATPARPAAVAASTASAASVPVPGDADLLIIGAVLLALAGIGVASARLARGPSGALT